MKRSKGISALVLIICIVFLAVSCADRSSPIDTESQTVPTTENVAEKSCFSLTKENAASFTIVYPEKGDSVSAEAATDLKMALAESGFEIEIMGDGVGMENGIPTDTNEILIGCTNRAESQEYHENLKCNDYVVAAAENRIIILGGSDAATRSAVEYFIRNYISGVDSELTLDTGVLNSYAGDYKRADILLFGKSISDYEIVIADSPDAITNHAANIIASRIKEETGHTLHITPEENASDKPQIKLLYTPDEVSEDEYAFEKDGNNLKIKAGKRTLLFSVREILASLSNDDRETVDITPTLSVQKMNLPSYPDHSTLEGKVPVGLCDQLNKKAVVIDLSAKDPTGDEAIIWEWAPSDENGFSGNGFNYQIDEFKLRYSEVLKTHVICVSSSGGFMGIAEYPSGQKIWETNAAGYGPHSIEYLPNGLVACALSGNGNTAKSEIRIYPVDKNGNISSEYIRDELVSAHGVHWDSEFGVLWALGDSEIIAYEISGTPEAPIMTRIEGFGADIGSGGHDFSADPTRNGIFWFSTSLVNLFDKYENKVISSYTGRSVITSKSVKCICVLPDGRILRTVATNVYKSHDTDTLAVFTKNESGRYIKTEHVFSNRAFYKARAILYALTKRRIENILRFE